MDLLRSLIQLALSDGILSKDEVLMIEKLGRLRGISKEKIDLLFRGKSQEQEITPLALDEKEREKYMNFAVQLMKVDGRIYREELVFCRRIAHDMGYSDAEYFHCIIHVKVDTEFTQLRDTGQK